MTIRIPQPIDFDDIPEFELIPAGVYDAVVEQVVYNEPADDSKLASLQAQYTLTEEGDLQGRVISQWVSIPDSDKQSQNKLFGTASRYKQFFAAFGFDPNQELAVDEDTGTVTDPAFSGAVVQIKIAVEPHYLERDRKVNKINTAPVVVQQTAAPKRGVRAGGRVVR